LQWAFSTAPQCYGLLYLALQDSALEHDPEKHAPHLMRGEAGFPSGQAQKRLPGDYAQNKRISAC
jgi:hypothetical protein